MRRRLSAALSVLFAACVLVSGCSAGSGVNTETVGPPSASALAPSSSLTSSPADSTALAAATNQVPSSVSASAPESSDGLTAQEAADRAAVQAQWIKSWDVYMAMATTPAGDREALIETVAVDPAKSNMLNDAAQFDSQGLRPYGTLGHRISWPQPIGGAATALIADCQDGSQTGSVNAATGDKVTVGVARDHYQGSLAKGDDGVWRVAQSYYLKDEPC